MFRFKSKKQKFVAKSFIALVLAQVLWGINTPVIKLGMRTVPLALYLSITIMGAALLVLPMALRHWKRLKRRDYLMVIIGSIISITLGNVSLLMGLQRVPSLNAPLIGLFAPLLLFILSAEFLKERLKLQTFVGILIAFAGAAICIGQPWSVSATGSEVITGSLFIVLAVLCDITGTLICKPVLKRANSFQVTFIHLFAGIIPVALFSLQYLSTLSIARIGQSGFLAIAYNILAVTIANCLFMYGLKHQKAQEVGIFQYIHPVVTAIAAWVILSEVPDKRLIVGAALIFSGVYLAEVKLTPHLHFHYHRRKH